MATERGYIRFTLHAQTIENVRVDDILSLSYVCAVENEDSLCIEVFVVDETISYQMFRNDIDKLIGMSSNIG